MAFNEKQEGQYDFSFFDNVIAKAKEKGIKVILGTPTATIPAWLAHKHPDILSEFEGGKSARLADVMSIVLTAQPCINTPKKLSVLW